MSHNQRLYELVGEDYDKGMDCIEKSEVFKELIVAFNTMKDKLPQCSRTAKYWLQYIRYVGILKDFIRSANS